MRTRKNRHANQEQRVNRGINYPGIINNGWMDRMRMSFIPVGVVDVVLLSDKESKSRAL